MTLDNGFYRKVVRNVRFNLIKIIRNRYLSRQQKVYLVLLGICPRFVRRVHARIRGL